MRGSKDQEPLRLLTKKKMRESGLTQSAMARRAGLAPATLSLWFNPERPSRLDPDNVIKLCGALHTLQPHATVAAVLREAEAEALAATG